MSATVPRTRHTPRGLPTNAFRLDGRVAVVTGGSKNIGLEVAATFLQAGAKVFIVGRNSDHLENAANDLRSLVPGADVAAVEADIASPEGPQRIAAAVEQTTSNVDILVNNAHFTGNTRDVPPLAISRATWSKVFDTNLFGPMELIGRLIAPNIEARRKSVVINMLSTAGFQPTPGLPAYSASKASLWMATRWMAAHLGPDVRVNAICPGIVTETGEPRFETGRQLLENGTIPLRRLGTPEEISAAALYLASDASSYTTGAVLHCNGGRLW